MSFKTNNKQNVLFVHKSGSMVHDHVAQHAVAQAVSCGYNVFVATDDIKIAISGSHFLDISKYWAGADKFSNIYKHNSVNNYQFELFCFQRWYVSFEVMSYLGVPLWVADTDVLVYPGIEFLSRVLGGKILNIPHTNYFNNLSGIEGVIEFFDKVYSEDGVLLSYVEKHRRQSDGVSQISDMIMFLEYARAYPDRVFDATIFGSFIGIDNSIRHTSRFEHMHGHKLIYMDGPIPFCKTTEGSCVRQYTLHFQGHSKPLMSAMNTISDEKILKELTNMSYYFSEERMKKVPALLDVKAVFDKWLFDNN